MKWVLTAVSKDRPGIVEEIAAIISRHQGNWVKSAMTRLGGQFAGIVQFTVENEHADSLTNELQKLTARGFKITLEQDLELDSAEEPAAGRTAFIELTGLDHPGIVHDITQLLRKHNVTIEELETGIFTASMAGQPMFYASAQIQLPEGLSIDDLASAAEAIANDIMVDINLEIEQQDF